jgi:hypothetical protein
VFPVRYDLNFIYYLEEIHLDYNGKSVLFQPRRGGATHQHTATAVATEFQQIMTEANGAESVEDRILAITEIVAGIHTL